MNPSTVIPSKSYAGIGKCIYCSRTFPPEQLTDEHIVPFALNGSVLFHKAACEPCRKRSNEEYENLALQADFLVPRLLLELKRRKKKHRKNLPSIAHGDQSLNDKAVFDIELRLAQYPRVLEFIGVDVPGKLEGVDRGSALSRLRVKIINLGDQPSYIGEQPVTTRHKHNHTAFGLTIVKIGYCFAVAERGLESFDGQEIRDLLSGKRDDLYNYFGSAPDSDRSQSSYLHKISIFDRNKFMIARVHLFASYKAHPYYVVLGKLP